MICPTSMSQPLTTKHTDDLVNTSVLRLL